MSLTDIKQLLPKDVYDAAIGANSPSAANVFATMADVGGSGGSAGTNSEFQFTDNAGGFFAGAIQQSAGHVVPTTTGVTNLGSATNYFSQLYAGTNWFYNGTTLVIKNNTPSDVMALSNSALSLYGGRNLAFTNTASDITWTSNGTISCAAADLLKLENTGAYLTFGQIGDGYGIGINRASDRSASLALAAQNPTTLSYQGFSLPAMTFANQSAVSSPLNGLQVHIEDGTDSIPYYNHSVDGWVPVGRYVMYNQTIANETPVIGNNQQMVSGQGTSGGEITYAPFRWGQVATNQYALYGTDETGAIQSNDLGDSSTNTRWKDLYFRGTLNHRYGNLTWTTGTNAGLKIKSTGDLRIGFTGTTGQAGMIIRDDAVETYDIDASAMMELRSTDRGFLPPRMTTAQMVAISSPVDGLIVHATDADRPHYNDGTSWKGFGDLYGLYAQTVQSATVTNTTTETSIIGTGVGTLSVPANGFKVGDSFHAKIGGVISTLNNHEITVRIMTGATVLASTGLISLEAATSLGWEMELDFTIASLGAAGDICTNGNFAYNRNTGALEGFVFQDVQPIDTTVANTLDITVEWNQANAADEIYSANFVLYRTYTGS